MPVTSTKIRKPSRKKLAAAAGEPNIASKLHELRRAAGLSQEALGAQGFISTPGWIKVENGQRMPSEKLLAALVTFLVAEKVIRATQKDALLYELCALKYAGNPRPFLKTLAQNALKEISPIDFRAAQ